ncbi:MAG: endonuclease/exonuclease/phosphatase family protein [Spirochaetaceae bacterium]|jgi:endonuclease/exonuclease/phosphatase family metal-dependent hydrolase|nr:endonuclease/exonuclease/phosphatase family protein [Spirochaetaceae bacterium]
MDISLLLKILKIAGIVIAVLVVIALIGTVYLSLTEYKPDAVEPLVVNPPAALPAPSIGDSLSILSWNIGYAALSDDQDFFMDGGKGIRPKEKSIVETNLKAIRDFIVRQNADISLLQEVDYSSHRSYKINEVDYLDKSYNGVSLYAPNFRVAFVPYPLPPIGSVESGLVNMNRLNVRSAERLRLPTPFTWPVRVANLKRALLVEYIPLANSDKQLVVINLHLEAYSSNEGRIAQMKVLSETMESEYKKGNYVIAGGDFNQTFPGIDIEKGPFAILEKDFFVPGVLSQAMIPQGFSYAVDTKTPSNRLNNKPYSRDDTTAQHYIIDGFILSPNVKLVSVQTINLNFVNSYHNPVHLEVQLR